MPKIEIIGSRKFSQVESDFLPSIDQVINFEQVDYVVVDVWFTLVAGTLQPVVMVKDAFNMESQLNPELYPEV